MNSGPIARSTMPRRQRGYSLIELLVAVTLGLVLLAGVVQVFISSKQGYQVQQSGSRFQEDSRFAIEYLGRQITLADLWDGAKPDAVKVVGTTATYTATGKCDDAWIVDTTNGIQGIQGYNGASAATGLADPPQTCIGSGYVANSDLLVVRHIDPDNYQTTANVKATTSPVTSTSGAWVRSLVGQKAQIYNASTMGSLTLKSDYDSGTLNYPYQAALFYLLTADNGEGAVPTLYMLITQNSGLLAQPLVDGVEMLKFMYGVDTNGDQSVDEYLDAGSIGTGTTTPNWSQVISVRVSMIIRGDTLDNFTDTQTYQMTDSFCYASSTTAKTALPSACTSTTSPKGTVVTYASAAAKYQRRLVVREIQLRNRVRG